jgi:NitT/TauT family transport system substrate-binding protein
MSRITDSGAGYVASYYSTFLPEGNPTIVYASTRAWAKANAAAARAFREAIVEGANFVKDPKNDAAVRAAIGKYIKLPPEVLAKAQISPPGPIVGEKQLAYWVGLMQEQEMLKSKPDLASLIFK